jgi:hypothetical protein
MCENESPVLSDMCAMHSNEASVQRVICAERGNDVRPHSDEARMHECEAWVRRNLSPVRLVIVRVQGRHAWLQSCDARVQRGSACLHMSYAHVHRDISVVH